LIQIHRVVIVIAPSSKLDCHGAVKVLPRPKAENYDYNRDRGFDRIVERAFPIKAIRGPWMKQRLVPVGVTGARISEVGPLLPREHLVSKQIGGSLRLFNGFS
jgi:hypothetical protein